MRRFNLPKSCGQCGKAEWTDAGGLAVLAGTAQTVTIADSTTFEGVSHCSSISSCRFAEGFSKRAIAFGQYAFSVIAAACVITMSARPAAAQPAGCTNNAFAGVREVIGGSLTAYGMTWNNGNGDYENVNGHCYLYPVSVTVTWHGPYVTEVWTMTMTSYGRSTFMTRMALWIIGSRKIRISICQMPTVMSDANVSPYFSGTSPKPLGREAARTAQGAWSGTLAIWH